MTSIAWETAVESRVLNGEFGCTASKAKQARPIGRGSCGPADLPGCAGGVLICAYHSDALETLPLDVALVGIGYEREPPFARLACACALSST